MRRWNLSCCALGLSVAAVSLVSCGGSQLPIGGPGTMPQAAAFAARANNTNYKVLYNFGDLPDGNFPVAGLIDVGGTLYGTTEGGGSQDRSCTDTISGGCGTVFSVTPDGRERVLYRFGGVPDGSAPTASLIDVGGKLYGTTSEGGAYDMCGYSSHSIGCGTVFSITTGGREGVLHSFGGYTDGSSADGAGPVASLIEAKGTLYGTTENGGANFGVVFSVTPSGVERVLHSFAVGTDGMFPSAGLIDVGGTLYGTTKLGGAIKCGIGSYACGTVFSITSGGTEKVLHSFGVATDGADPVASLIEFKGRLYGTTVIGGSSKCNIVSSCGTVFSITRSGTERVLHRFHGGTGGAGPGASLINVGGTLYGTTYSGGKFNDGTVFSITPSGKVTVVHSFGGGTDGMYPSAGLIDVGGTLYGTTEAGGTSGKGTVFALTP